jgi:hypothetical protein
MSKVVVLPIDDAVDPRHTRRLDTCFVSVVEGRRVLSTAIHIDSCRVESERLADESTTRLGDLPEH